MLSLIGAAGTDDGLFMGEGNGEWRTNIQPYLGVITGNGGILSGLFNDVNNMRATVFSASIAGGDCSASSNLTLYSTDGGAAVGDLANTRNLTLFGTHGGSVRGSFLGCQDSSISSLYGSMVRLGAQSSSNIQIVATGSSICSLAMVGASNIHLMLNAATVAGNCPSNYTNTFNSGTYILGPNGVVYSALTNGNVTANSFTGNGAGLTNIGVVAALRTNWSYSPTLGTNLPSGILLSNVAGGPYTIDAELFVTNFTAAAENASVIVNWNFTLNGTEYDTDLAGLGIIHLVVGTGDEGLETVSKPIRCDPGTTVGFSLVMAADTNNVAGEVYYTLRRR